MGCPTCTLWGTGLHEQSGEKGIPQGPVFCLFLYFLSHFQVTFSTNRSLRWQGVGCLLHDSIALHILHGVATGVCPPASAWGRLRLFPCHLRFTSSSFSLWPEDFYLGSCPDLLSKQRAEAMLSEEALHISDRFRDICSRQRLVCSSHLSLAHTTHIIQVSPLLCALACSCTCYFQIRSHISPSLSYHHWDCSFH